MILTASNRVKLTTLINYLEKGSAGNTPLDQVTAQQLTKIFANTCTFTNASHRPFADAITDSPVSTLLRVILCVDSD